MKLFSNLSISQATFLFKLSDGSELKQINKDNSVGYLAEHQTFTISEKLIEQYEERIKELKERLKKYED